MKKKYKPATAEIIHLDKIDVVLTSIGEDLGENDGEWTSFVFDRPKSVGIWE